MSSNAEMSSAEKDVMEETVKTGAVGACDGDTVGLTVTAVGVALGAAVVGDVVGATEGVMVGVAVETMGLPVRQSVPKAVFHVKYIRPLLSGTTEPHSPALLRTSLHRRFQQPVSAVGVHTIAASPSCTAGKRSLDGFEFKHTKFMSFAVPQRRPAPARRLAPLHDAPTCALFQRSLHLTTNSYSPQPGDGARVQARGVRAAHAQVCQRSQGAQLRGQCARETVCV